jgi:hypothetical protein
MIAAPFARLPRKKYHPVLDNSRRVDLDHLKNYVSESSSSSSGDESLSYRFSDSDSNSDSEGSESSSSSGSRSSYSYQSSKSDVNLQPEPDEVSHLTHETVPEEEDDDLIEKASVGSSSQISSIVTKSTLPSKKSLYKKWLHFLRKRRAYVKFQIWRKKNAEKRRHAIIRHYEAKIVEYREQIRQDVLHEIEEQEK